LNQWSFCKKGWKGRRPTRSSWTQWANSL